jgi:carboxyl-terminal processing protease
MKQLSKNLLFAASSIVIVLVIFSAGFYAGHEQIGIRASTEVNAGTQADLTTFWKVWNLVHEKYVPASAEDTINDEARVLGAIKGMVDAVGDPYTTFFTPEENADFEESISGKFKGVGMEIGKRDGMLVVVAPMKDSPAEKAGIKSGDIILKIDGESAADLSVDAAVQKIRGEKGTKVSLTLVREGDTESQTIEVVRDEIRIPTLEYKMRNDGVFVISLFNFSAGVEKDFREALRAFVLAKSDKLIIDLRGNPGGFLDAAVDVSSWFLPAGKVVVRENFGSANTEEKIFRSKGYNIFNTNLKMVVLVDGGSASASEIVAGALKEHKVATIMGETTFGKGSVQELITVTDNTALKVTIAQWLTPEGNSISKHGLEPDIVVEQDDKDLEAKKDTQLEKAVEFLLSKSR